MNDLNATTPDPTGGQPGDPLINIQSGNQRIRPDFAHLEGEKVAVIVGFSRKAGKRFRSKISCSEVEGQNGKRRF